MNLTQQLFAIFAIPGTVALVVQTILLVVGMGTHDADADGADAGADGGLDGDVFADPGLRVLTVRGLVAFFAVGGWVGIALIDWNVPVALAAVLALLAGLGGLFLVAWLFKVMLRLQSAGNLDIRNAIGSVGRVYLTVPGGGRFSGKVTLLLQERAVELEALTDGSQPIPTGSQVQVTGIRGSQIIVVPLVENETDMHQHEQHMTK
ncbi:MAG: hypothetical protein GX112_01215 [Clostridiaceae bacterium]|jgi:hypothetical protein|nr:hypothetical protein [Clostridiaceae bacterium]